MSRRADRINGLLREEISLLLSREVKDPRLDGLISITRVDTSSDLRNARGFLSVMGDQASKDAALQGIQSAASFLRRSLRDRLKLRYVPFLKFAIDERHRGCRHVAPINGPAPGQSASSGPLA